MSEGLPQADQAVLDREGLQALFDVLKGEGYQVVGPTVRDGASVYDEVGTLDQLPAGWRDEQDGGKYRLIQNGNGALFGYAMAPQSWKRWLLLPTLRLFRSRREGRAIQFIPESHEAPKRAAWASGRAS